MPSNVRVVVRVRPMLPHEIEMGHSKDSLEIDQVNNQIRLEQLEDPKGKGNQGHLIKKNYKFDKILDSKYTQNDVFETLQSKQLISKVIQGFHATIFAYGQTGSGKTYTMEGYKYNEKSGNDRSGKPIIEQNNFDSGLTIRAIQEAFKQAEDIKKEKTVIISCSFLQIYNEKIFDLLNTSSVKKNNNKAQTGLKMRWSKNDQFTVENLFVFRCNDADHCIQLYNKGVKNKIVASHNLNAQSSRSHAMFTLQFELIDNQQVNNQVISKLQLVDLAGSERTSLTGNMGTLGSKEAIEINKSLFTLRKVITSLAERTKGKLHVPYRDSKLTSLLKQSLGGNSYCLMVACLSPCDAYIEENISTLNYATKASYISNEPSVNVDPKTKMIMDLKQKVNALQKELQQANQHIELLSDLTGNEENKTNAPNKAAPVRKALKEQNQQNVFHPIKEEDEDDNVNNQHNVKKEPSGRLKPDMQSQQVVQQQQTSYVDQNQEMFHKLNAADLSKRMIESVNMLKEMMQSNRQLRERVDGITEQTTKYENDAFHMSQENLQLREKIEILESVIGSQTNDFDQMDWRDVLSDDLKKPPQAKSNNQAVNGIITDFFEIRKSAKEQEQRTAQVEAENEELRKEMQMMQHQMSQMAQVYQQQRQGNNQQQYKHPFQNDASSSPYNVQKQNPNANQAVRKNNFIQNDAQQRAVQEDKLRMLNEMMYKKAGSSSKSQPKKNSNAYRR